MNGVHDMGGMHGFGPVDPEPNEPRFHHPWEARALAVTIAMGAWKRWNIDASRFARESIPPEEYLRMSYYEKWIAGLCELMVAKGLVTREELATGHPGKESAKLTPPLLEDGVAPMLNRGSPTTRDVQRVPRFGAGETVRARNMHPTGHTRLPRYVRGRIGTVHMDHGVHVLPDSNAHFKGESPERLYSVRFSAKELWGPQGASRDAVYLDLWESYLEPV